MVKAPIHLLHHHLFHQLCISHPVPSNFSFSSYSFHFENLFKFNRFVRDRPNSVLLYVLFIDYNIYKFINFQFRPREIPNSYKFFSCIFFEFFFTFFWMNPMGNKKSQKEKFSIDNDR